MKLKENIGSIRRKEYDRQEEIFLKSSKILKSSNWLAQREHQRDKVLKRNNMLPILKETI